MLASPWFRAVGYSAVMPRRLNAINPAATIAAAVAVMISSGPTLTLPPGRCGRWL